ncbi:sulfotransferase 2A1-like isoform X2 [Nycticebus coucang]|uniref:sulfotransferase 2A1-like isoform X2 n=1 Tax=Nycticebus coucang TaxID=9470 RepID=UPI00234D0B31|nr:sulfotransferase 2A1-like isoform X2 [Nycticebus coucang]
MANDNLWYEGIPFPRVNFKLEILRKAQEEFMVEDDDVVTVTYPKSGTNWLIEILCLIHSKGDTKWIQSVPIWKHSPWIETQYGFASANKMEGPRLLSSHLPIHLFPKSFFSSKAKVIYVIRNPKDIIVSGHFFWNSVNLAKKPKSMEQYLEWFLEGNVPYGSWFDHVRGWVSMRERENFLMLSYEELKQDTERTVEKICHFLGVTGDWKNYFTIAQAETFDKVFQEKMADLPRELFPWE